MRAFWIAAVVLLAGGWLQPGVGMAQAGFDGVILIRSTSRHVQDTATQMTKGRKARLDYTCGLDLCTMIADADAHVAMFISHHSKSYLTMTQADGRQLAAIGEKFGTAVVDRSKAQETGDWDSLKFAETGKTALVAGVTCKVWVGHHPDAGKSEKGEVCLGTGGIGLAMQLLMSAIVGDTAVGKGAARESGSELPLEELGSGILRLVFTKDGRPSTVVEAIRIEPKAIDDTLFSPPTGYQETRAADMLVHAQAALEQLTQGPGQPAILSPRPGDTLSYPRSDDSRMPLPPRLQSCAWDSLPPSDMLGYGEVTYRVTSEGIPDTVTVTVVRVYGAEAATFRAAAQKVAAACRFSPTPGGALLRQEMKFKGTPDYSDPEIFIDAPLDEPVEVVSCNPEGFTQTGELTLEMVIGLDGYPEPGTIHATTAKFPALEAEARLIIAKCLYKPARYKGVPVRQKIQFTIKVGSD